MALPAVLEERFANLVGIDYATLTGAERPAMLDWCLRVMDRKKSADPGLFEAVRSAYETEVGQHSQEARISRRPRKVPGNSSAPPAPPVFGDPEPAVIPEGGGGAAGAERPRKRKVGAKKAKAKKTRKGK